MKKITLLLFALLAYGWQGYSQFTEDFEGTFLPIGWAKEVSSGNDITQSTTYNHTVAGTKSARFSSYSNASNYNQYLFTQAITVTAPYTQLKFWHREYGSGDNITWGVSTATASSVDVSTWNSITNSSSDWAEVVVDLSSYVGQTIYFGFHYYGNYAYYAYLDDVTLSAPPACQSPTSLTASNITTTSADLSWTAGGTETVWNVEVVASGATPTCIATDTAVSNPFTVTGLTANTTYDYYVQADCGGGDTSSCVGPFSFTTACEAISVFPYTQDFDGAWDCWSVNNYDSDGYTWSQSNTYITPTHSGTYAAHGMGNSDDYLISPQFTLTGNERIKFFDKVESATYNNTYDVLLSTTGKEVADFTINLGTINCTNTSWVEHIVDVSAYSGNVYIALHQTYSGSAYYGFGVDDFTVELAPLDEMDWNNVQWVSYGANGSNTSLTVDVNTPITVYAQGYEGGLTDTTTGAAAAGVECWVAINSENTDPSTWSPSLWKVATFSSEQGSNDEYSYTTAATPPGTNYVASRWRLNNAGFTYAGYNGPWDGTNNVNVELIVNPLANDECSGAIALTVNADLDCGTVTSGTVTGASDSGVTGSTCYGADDDDVWYSFVATATSHRVSLTNVTGSVTDMYHAVYAADSGCGTLGAAIVCSDSDTSNPTGLTIGDTYLVQVYTYTSTGGQSSTFNICVGTPPPPPANDDCSTATALTTFPYSSSVDATLATNNNGFISTCGGMNDGVWYIFTPTTDGTVDITVSGVVGWDPELALYSGSCGVFTCVDSADSGGTSSGETIMAQAVTAGVTYFINVGHYSGTTNNSEGPFSIAVSYSPTLSIENLDASNTFTYFPNPVNNTLSLRAQNAIANVSIYNMLGQEVLRTSPNTLNEDVDMSALQSGAYFVNVTIGNNSKTIKVIKN